MLIIALRNLNHEIKIFINTGLVFSCHGWLRPRSIKEPG
ncbi:hypothetical protein GXM_08476 [Nostoc sphaeroides CCNUC1]|uniref:Uncharacterized protein n=1 Tax=Nostoc sphaeroides CCNUC1 TaxID=2653204 RepID=A0A5P8WEM4_9NOSO|nr:hypothetical protein GXM_08476 [Nostoc sphaeroides CCNUC1]